MISILDSFIRTETEATTINKLVNIRGKVLHGVVLSKNDVQYLKDKGIM